MLSATSVAFISDAEEALWHCMQTMVIPHGDPRESLMAQEKIQVCSIGCMSFSVVIQRKDRPVRQRNSPNRLTPSIVSILVFIKIIAQVKNIIYRVLSSWISIRIEESKGEVATGVHGKPDFCDRVIRFRRCLRPTDRTADT